jgi:hypothetical protein
MGSKSSAGSIIASVLISLILMSAIIYFGLPFLFPSINEENKLAQVQSGTWNSPSFIFDNDLAYQKMEDTELDIETEGASFLIVSFKALAIMTLDSSFNIRSSYNVTLSVEGIKNETKQYVYYDSSGSTGAFRQLTYTIDILLITDILSSGTYTVSVFWKSTFDAPGTGNSFSVAHEGGTSDYNYTRTLLIQEIRD